MPHFAPFCTEPSDLKLRSSDGVTYAVHSRRLRKLSARLDSTLQLSPGRARTDLTMSESSSTLDVALPFLYERPELANMPAQSMTVTAGLYAFCLDYDVSPLIFDTVRTHAFTLIDKPEHDAAGAQALLTVAAKHRDSALASAVRRKIAAARKEEADRAARLSRIGKAVLIFIACCVIVNIRENRTAAAGLYWTECPGRDGLRLRFVSGYCLRTDRRA